MKMNGMEPFSLPQELKELIYVLKILLILTGCYRRRRKAQLPLPAGMKMIIAFNACQLLNDESTAICTKTERDFLRTLSGGCSTPISALAVIKDNKIIFKGNLCSVDGKQKLVVEKEAAIENANDLGITAGKEILKNEQARKIISEIKNGK